MGTQKIAAFPYFNRKISKQEKEVNYSPNLLNKNLLTLDILFFWRRLILNGAQALDSAIGIQMF